MALPLSAWRIRGWVPTLADPLPQAGPADEVSGDLGLLSLGHVPGHHLAAPDIDHQIEVEPDATELVGR
jgi:hypothetical protein